MSAALHHKNKRYGVDWNHAFGAWAACCKAADSPVDSVFCLRCAMKKCFKCKTDKPIGDFYCHPKMADGHLNKCKECTKNDVRRDRQEKPNARIYDKRRYKENPRRREIIGARSRRWRKLYPERYKAHTEVGNAVRNGRVVKPVACSVCGETGKRVEGHHPCYSKPLEVIWCCTPCHRRLDGLTKPIQKGST